jgi:hypothetical protein
LVIVAAVVLRPVYSHYFLDSSSLQDTTSDLYDTDVVFEVKNQKIRLYYTANYNLANHSFVNRNNCCKLMLLVSSEHYTSLISLRPVVVR